jgi:hypothetical protein
VRGELATHQVINFRRLQPNQRASDTLQHAQMIPSSETCCILTGKSIHKTSWHTSRDAS